MFDRTVSMIGYDNYEKIKNLNILVIGLGGVGAFVVEALVRSGVECLTIIDKDVYDETNLNRQLPALRETIGKNKCDVVKMRIKSVNPKTKVNAINTHLTSENIKDLLLSKYDYVVDAIDEIEVKKCLIKKCSLDNVKIISSMGTARKLHPELLEITSLAKTEYDPIARILRRELKELNLNKIMVVSSKEVPLKTSGSMMFVPAGAGNLIASYIINETIK